MATRDTTSANRLERRKKRTRSALIQAAQAFVAAGKLNASVLDITRTADVGMGSFYNHFDSKEELFEAAVEDAYERHGDLLDTLTGDVDDPAEVFAQSFRLTGRLFRKEPELTRVLLNNRPGLITSPHGMAPRALRDIKAANDMKRFTVSDPHLALALAAGAVMGLGQLLLDQPDRDDAISTDSMTERLLRVFGLDSAEAHRICSLPLPIS